MASHGRFDFSNITPAKEEEVTRGTIADEPSPMMPSQPAGRSAQVHVTASSSSPSVAATAPDSGSEKEGSTK